ncbi:MAG: hypothetical protein ACOC1F_05590 [Myxococcota bacterium]
MDPPSGPSTALRLDRTIAWEGSLGYAPADWVAIAGTVTLDSGSADVEVDDASQAISLTHVAPMVTGRVYPFHDFGFNLEVGGGWSWFLVDLEGMPSSLHGPAYTIALGISDRIGFLSSPDEPMYSQTLGVQLRFDHAPALKSDDWEGSGFGLTALFTASL